MIVFARVIKPEAPTRYLPNEHDIDISPRVHRKWADMDRKRADMDRKWAWYGYQALVENV